MVSAWLFFVASVLASIPAYTQSAWRKADTMSADRHKHSAVWMGNTNVLIMGGYTGATTGQFSGHVTSSCELLDASTGKITSTAPMPHARAEFPVLFDADSNVIVIGGVSDEAGMRAVDRYVRATQTWETVGELVVGRRQHTAQWVSDTTILVVGGRNHGVGTIGTCELFNVKTGTSAPTRNYPIIANSLVSFKDKNNQVYVLGGRSGGENSARLPFIFTYNPVDSFWKESEYLNISVVAPSISDLSLGRGSIISGGAAAESPFTTSKGVWWWTGSNLISFSKLNTGRQWHGSAQFDRERIIVGGGYVDGVQVTASCEWINIESGYVYEAPSLLEARSYVTFVSVPATFLPEGRPDKFMVVAIGGVSLGKGSTMVEILGVQSRIDCDPTQHRIVFDRTNTEPVGVATYNAYSELTNGIANHAGAMWLRERFDALSPFTITYTIAFESEQKIPDTLRYDAGFGIVITDSDALQLGSDDVGYGYDGLNGGVAFEVRAYASERDTIGPRICLRPAVNAKLSSKNAIAEHSYSNPQLSFMQTNTLYYGRISYDGQTLYSYLDTLPGTASPDLVVQYTDSQLGKSLNWNSQAHLGFTSNGLPGLKTCIRRCEVSSCTTSSIPTGIKATPGQPVVSDAAFTIYPQPASSICTVQIPAGSQDHTCSIYLHDVQGTIVGTFHTSNSDRQEIDVSVLPNGLYAVSILDGSNIVRSTIVVMH